MKGLNVMATALQGLILVEFSLSVGGRTRYDCVKDLTAPPWMVGDTAKPLFETIPISKQAEPVRFVVTSPRMIRCPRRSADPGDGYCLWNTFLAVAIRHGFDRCRAEDVVPFALGLSFDSQEEWVRVISDKIVYVAMDPLKNPIECGTYDIFRVRRRGNIWLGTMPCNTELSEDVSDDHAFDLDRLFLMRDIRI